MKGLLKSLLRVGPVGRAVTRITGFLSLGPLHTRIARITNFVPATVSFRPAGGRGAFRTVKMLRGREGIDHIVRAIWTTGWRSYEAPMPILWCAFATESRSVLDVGVNSGFYAILATACGCRVVHAFEPFPLAMQRLKDNLALNGMLEQVVCVDKAVADKPGQAKLYVPTERFDGMLECSSSLNSNFRAEHKQVIGVTVTTIDDYVAASGLIDVDLVKIDVESQEHLVLRGMENLLRTQRPVIFVEVLRSGGVEIEQIRERYDYVCLQLYPGAVHISESVVPTGNRDQVLCPREKLNAVRACVARAGLDCT